MLLSKEFYVYTAPREDEADCTIDNSQSWTGEHVECERKPQMLLLLFKDTIIMGCNDGNYSSTIEA